MSAYVHNHGPESGPGLACGERLVGNCMVVIDVADLFWLPNRLRHDADRIGGKTAEYMRGIADQIEPQVSLPKPDEPTGLGAVVEDVEGQFWVRDQRGWWIGGEQSIGRRSTPHWHVVNAVKVLSEGVS